jgi:prepilin-type processing-associated H-X9-DG protein
MFRLTRIACAAVVAAAGLVSVPACKKKPKPPEPDSPNSTPGTNVPNPGPNPAPLPNVDSSLPAAPRGPLYNPGDLRTATLRAAAQKQLGDIGRALHLYHDAMQGFPTAIPDKTGKPGLSWRVAILPYIEQDNLYKLFKLDEPWDSPNNKPLLHKMPKIFAPTGYDPTGWTFLRGFTGPGTWLPPQTGPKPTGIRLTSIADGTSNTILVAEAADPVIWTKPDEMEFGPNKVPKIGGVFGGGTNALFADGSVKFLPKNLDQRTLANLIQIADGNVVNLD